jgi:hypothetical protein
MGLFSGPHQPLAYADDVTVLGDNMDIVKKTTKILIYASKAVCAKKTKLLSHRQNAGQNHYIMIANRQFENVAEFRYLEKSETNQNLFQEEIKKRLNSSNACYNSVQNLLSSRLLSKNVKLEYTKL